MFLLGILYTQRGTDFRTENALKFVNLLKRLLHFNGRLNIATLSSTYIELSFRIFHKFHGSEAGQRVKEIRLGNSP